MSYPENKPLQKLQFYVTTSYSCSYLPKQLAQSLIAAPQHLVSTDIYSGLIQQGFRRSGKFVYRPHCENCQACVPVRIVADAFQPSRSQKRAYKQHKNLTATIRPADFYDEHYQLYEAYQQTRHLDESKETESEADNDIEQYQSFLCQSNVETVMVEFRENAQLKMVSVIDIVHDGISAVYTFYDTTDPKASYGTYNVVWQANWAKEMKLPYVYLGYWIKDSRKMAYKQNFQPLEKLIDGDWTD